jgi:hypothetical protein
MRELSVNRTLVKSPPELWSEVSEVERLANHLGEFGEITISRLEPEHTVAWEGECACGTVELEASGWGTKVTMKAEVREVEGEAPAPVPAALPAQPPPSPVPPRPTVHQVIPDLEAWDRAAAEIESHARRQTAAAQRAAERAAERTERAERAERDSKGRLGRWLFRGRRAEPEAVPPSHSPYPEPPARTHWSDHTQAPAPQVPGPAAPEPLADIRQPSPAPQPEPNSEQHEAAGGGAPAVDEERARAVLEAALDNLGAAHHRPFSRG